jgi:CDP-paratose 2-epimerase
MSVVIITGSSGLIGSEAVNFFCEKGFDVIGIDSDFRKIFFGNEGSTIKIKNKNLKENKNFKSYSVDIRNYNSLAKIFKKNGGGGSISLIIHCAAQPSHDYGKDFPILDFEINAKGTLNLLELCKIYCSDAPFIFMSTNKVYGDNPNKLPLLEKNKRWEIRTTDKNFGGIDEKFSIDNCTHSFFGVSKTYADLIVQEYGKNIGLKTVSFRAGCITGPNHSGVRLHGFLSYLVKRCLKEKKYSLIGFKGKQVRDNLHSSDLVNCFWEFFKKPRYGEVYNIGGGRYSNCSILEALDIVENISQINIKKEFVKTNRVGDHIWYISNIKKFRKHYPNWKQKYNTRKIIDELINNIN